MFDIDMYGSKPCESGYRRLHKSMQFQPGMFIFSRKKSLNSLHNLYFKLYIICILSNFLCFMFHFTASIALFKYLSFCLCQWYIFLLYYYFFSHVLKVYISFNFTISTRIILIICKRFVTFISSVDNFHVLELDKAM